MTSKKTCLIFVLTLFSYPLLTIAAEIKELALSTPRPHAGEKHEGDHVDDRLLCVDGLKVFQTATFGFGIGSGTAVSNIQLFEVKDGKVVPATCQ